MSCPVRYLLMHPDVLSCSQHDVYYFCTSLAVTSQMCNASRNADMRRPWTDSPLGVCMREVHIEYHYPKLQQCSASALTHVIRFHIERQIAMYRSCCAKTCALLLWPLVVVLLLTYLILAYVLSVLLTLLYIPRLFAVQKPIAQGPGLY